MPGYQIPHLGRPSYTSGYAVGAGDAENPQLWNGLVGGYFAVLGNTGGRLRDISGRQRHGALVSTTWIRRDGEPVLAFDGSDSVVNLNGTEGVFNGLDHITVTIWIKRDSGGNNWQGIIQARDSTINGFGFNSGTTQVQFRLNNTAISESNLTFGTWYHLTATYDGSDVRIYRDGVETASGAKTGTISQTDLFRIGWDDADSSRHLLGEISSVMLHTRVLTPNEIQANYRDELLLLRRKPIYVSVPDATATKQFAATITASSIVNANHLRKRALDATIIGSGITTADIARTRKLLASVVASSIATASHNRIRKLDAAVTSSAIVSAAIDRTRGLIAAVTSSVIVTPSLGGTRALAATIISSAISTAAIGRTRELVAAITSNAIVTSTLGGTRAMSAAITASVIATAGIVNARPDPELPRVTPGTLPPVGWDGTADVVITDVDSLQTAIDNADTSGGMYIIELTAGDSWTGSTITLPSDVNDGGDWLVLRTSNFANLPAEGNRLQPSPVNDADMAVISGNTSSPFITLQILAADDDASGGATKIAFIGIEFRPSGFTSSVVLSGRNSIGPDNRPTNSIDFTSDLIWYQCRFTTENNATRIRDLMLRLDGNNVVCSCCDFFGRGTASSQSEGVICVRSYIGTGIRVYNNRLRSGGPSAFLADNGAAHGNSPHDVTIDHNYMTREFAWDDDGELHKNIFEIKGTTRLLFERNILEVSWRGEQAGTGLVIKNIATETLDIMIRDNIIRSAAQCFFVEGREGVIDDATEGMKRVTLQNNLFYDISEDYDHDDSGNAKFGSIDQFNGELIHFHVIGNTFYFSNGRGRFQLHQGGGHPDWFADDFVFRDNIMAASKAGGFFRSNIGGVGDNIPVLNYLCNPYTIEFNAFVSYGSGNENYNAANLDDDGGIDSGSICDDNYYPTDRDDLGFVDVDNDDYEINSGTFATASSTGGVIGADVPDIETKTVNVVTGTITVVATQFSATIIASSIVTADHLRTRAMSAVITTSVITTAVVTKASDVKALAATVVVSATTTAAIDRTRQFSAAIAATGVVTVGLIRRRGLSATITNSVAVSATMPLDFQQMWLAFSNVVVDRDSGVL